MSNVSWWTSVNLSLKRWRHSKQVLPPSRQQQSRRNLQSAAELGKVINVFCHFFFFAFIRAKYTPLILAVFLCDTRLGQMGFLSLKIAMQQETKYTRVSLSVCTDNEVLRYWYNEGYLVISSFSRPCYQYILGLFITTNKWLRPRSRYPYSVRIRRYVRINFVLIVNQTRVVL